MYLKPSAYQSHQQKAKQQIKLNTSVFFCVILFAAHRAAYLAGESPAAVIGCMPYSYNRRLIGVTRQAKARS